MFLLLDTTDPVIGAEECGFSLNTKTHRQHEEFTGNPRSFRKISDHRR